MRIFILILVLLLIIPLQAQEDLYEAGDYLGAIALYEARIASGEANGSTYYNLANAYYESGQMALALLNYRRAEIFLPRDADIALQLARLRGQRQDFIGAEVDYLQITSNLSAEILTLHEFAWIVFVLWSLFFMLIAFKRERLAYLFWAIAFALFLGITLMGTRLYVETFRPEAVLLTEAVEVMTGPAEDYLPLYLLYSGAELRVLEERGEWARFLLADGRSGWLETQNLAFIQIPD